MHKYRIIDCDEDLKATVETICQQDSYALDTEFHREHTYWPKVALVQIAWLNQIVLIDPLATKLAPLKALMESDALAVVHAAAQDFEVLNRECGAIPKRFFDTQIAAGFLGLAAPSLALLHQRELGVELAKGHRFTNWLKRPLGVDQLEYAAADVARLIEIQDRLVSQLKSLHRTRWVEDEFVVMRQRSSTVRDPNEAWRKIKALRQLKGRTLVVARALAAWREQHAATVDRPVRNVLPDLAVAAIAQAMPSNLQALKKIRGVDPGVAKGKRGAEIINTVALGLAEDWQPPPKPKRRDSARDYRCAVTLAAAWINQFAKDQKLDPALLATRADIEAFVRGDKTARLSQGWRADLAAEQLRRLVDGDAALVCDQDILVLEARSRQSLT